MSQSIINRARPEVLAMKGYSSARSLYKDTAGMVFLDANECFFEPYIGAENLARYPSQQPGDLIDALCRLYDLSSRNLAVTRGADDGIDLLVRSFCVAGQDNIIICPPTFPMYAHSAILQGADVKEVLLKENFDVDVKGIVKAADDNTKIIFLCSPNNPTGTLVAVEDVEALCDEFKETALVVVDETYIEFSSQESFISLIDKYENLVVLRTLSKAYAAAGLRCGMSIGPAEVIALLLKILPPYPLPQPMIREALRILEPKNLERIAEKRVEILETKKWFISELKNIKEVQNIIPSEANFILAQIKNASALCQKAQEGGFILRDQSYQVGLDNSLRISIGSRDEMEGLLRVLKGEVVEVVKKQRLATINRKTSETNIAVRVNLDALSPVTINTGIGFYDHMLEQIAKHGGFSLVLECDGDLHIDPHHSIEDCAIALGQALKKALGDKLGIGRFGFTLPMDETLAHVALDLSGRFYLDFEAEFPADKVGDLPTDMVRHIFQSLAENLQANLHIKVEGENTHHMVEACFKGFGRALRQALKIEGDALPSTKGIL